MPILLPKNGEGFTLRTFMREDAMHLAEIEFDVEVKKFLVIPKKDKSQWINEFNPDTYHGYAIDINGVLAGRVSLIPKEGVHELAIVIGKPFLGSKLGRKVAPMLIRAAFDELNTNALVAVVHPNHQASINLLRAFKFRRRGIVESSESYQQGFFIYRMSQGTYNLTFERDRPEAACPSI